MSKKKVTAPTTYNPGSGHPKEYLAYLNWQEMQALQRLNGNGPRRGPKGIPSFADDSASSLGNERPPESPYSGYQGGGDGGFSGNNYSDAGSESGGGGYGGGDYGGGGSSYSGSSTGAYQSSRDTAASPESPSPSQQQSPDTAAQNAAEVNNAKEASLSSALMDDARRGGISSINVGPMQTPVAIGGGQIHDALSEVASYSYRPVTPPSAALGAVTRGPGSVSGMIPGNRDPRAQIQSLYGVTNAMNETFGTSYSPNDVSEMARAIAGEAAGEDRFGRAAVANTMFNRIAPALADPKTYGYMGGTNPTKLLGQYDATGLREGTFPNKTYLAAKPGTENYRAGLEALSDAMNQDSQFSKLASPTVRAATHYYNPDDANPEWGARSGRNFERVGRHVFGNAEPIESAVLAARSMTPSSFGASMFAEATPTSTISPAAAGNEIAAADNVYSGSFLSGLTPDPIVNAAISGAAKLPSALSGFKIPSIAEASSMVKAMPDFAKVAAMKAMAPSMGDRLSGMFSAGIGAISDKISEYAPAGLVETKLAEVEDEYRNPYKDVYGPKYVPKDIQKEMSEIARKNEIATNIGKRVPGVGLVLRGADAIRNVLTGTTTAEADEMLKNQYLQSNPEQQAELERQYPNLTKFAMDAGLTSQLPESNYRSWAQRAGLIPPGAPIPGSGSAGIGGIPTQELGGKQSYETAYVSPGPSYPSYPSYTPTPQETGGRPYDYYLWDLGVGIPSPGDPDYNDYQEYLAGREPSART